MSDYEASGYWYPQGDSEPKAVDLLNLLRQYRDTERKMRLETRSSMGMNENDLLALRFLLRAHSRGEIPRQRDFAKELGISDASVSVLIDRLCRDGYAERIAHPKDRRSAGIIPTEYSDTEVRATLAKMHHRMLEAASSLSAEEMAAAAKFLSRMIESIK